MNKIVKYIILSLRILLIVWFLYVSVVCYIAFTANYPTIEKMMFFISHLLSFLIGYLILRFGVWKNDK